MSHRILLALAMFLAAGCAQPPCALPANHPSNPSAAEAPMAGPLETFGPPDTRPATEPASMPAEEHHHHHHAG